MQKEVRCSSGIYVDDQGMYSSAEESVQADWAFFIALVGEEGAYRCNHHGRQTPGKPNLQTIAVLGCACSRTDRSQQTHSLLPEQHKSDADFLS